jgi:iduronate 2-sulfatase
MHVLGNRSKGWGLRVKNRARVFACCSFFFGPFFLAPLVGANLARPNVLFIAVDDLRTNLGCYGDPVAVTPHLDRLAARGRVFARAYTQQAVCNPSRQSLLSGRRPDSIRVWDLHTHFRETSPDVVSLPEYFKLNGYFTQGIGKIYHGAKGMSDPPSWSVPERYESVPRIDDYRLPRNRRTAVTQKQDSHEFADASEDEYPDGQIALAAIKALEQFAAEGQPPFFLAVGIRKPHLPFTAPKKYWELFENIPLPTPDPAEAPRRAPALALHDSPELRGYADVPVQGELSAELIANLRRGYYAATTFADAQIGRVLDALERTGLDRSTIVVVWGDHGFHLGEQGLWTKTTNFEADTRVPLIIATPLQSHPGQTTRALVELLDLYPTLVDMCGLPPAGKLEGQTVAPLVRDPGAPGRKAVYSQFPRPFLHRGAPVVMGYSVRTQDHRYTEWRDARTGRIEARELYLYVGDEIFERNNLAADPRHRRLLNAMAHLLPPTRVLRGPSKGAADWEVGKPQGLDHATTP